MNIIFVCTGNTCRSPMAEGYLKSLKTENVVVSSAGLSCSGEKVSENSALVMSEMGIDIWDHTSKCLTEEAAKAADKIYVMTTSHYLLLSDLLTKCGIDNKKISLLDENGIPDPFLQDISVYRNCRDRIIDAINNIFGINPVKAEILDISAVGAIELLEKECFSTPWSSDSIAESMKGNNVFFGIKENKLLCGYISMYYSCGEGYINNLAVRTDQRRKGYGKALLCELIKFCATAEYEFITLEVRESNLPAINLYKSFGFKEEGRRKNYYDAPKEDAIILTRRFKND